MTYPTLAVIVKKTIVVQTVTYFVIGLTSFLVFDYTKNYADPAIATFMRPMDHPLVTAGALFQILRGALFGIVFYSLRDIYFGRDNGWLTIWLALLVIGVIGPFGAAPSSIEGMAYTLLPLWFHVMSLPELVIQSGLLAYVTNYWVRNPNNRWFSIAIVTLFFTIVTITTAGAISKIFMAN